MMMQYSAIVFDLDRHKQILTFRSTTFHVYENLFNPVIKDSPSPLVACCREDKSETKYTPVHDLPQKQVLKI